MKSLFQANLIEEIVLNIHPQILGSGIPLFRQLGRQIDFALLASQPLKNDCLVVSYRVKH